MVSQDFLYTVANTLALDYISYRIVLLYDELLFSQLLKMFGWAR